MGYRLKVVAGPGTGSECDLEESEITIGRAPENGMVINDTNVSRVHAKFSVAPGNRVVVADNGSRNGVYVNDRKVNKQPLSPGDRVVIGQSVIELVADGARGSGSGKAARASPQPSAQRRPNGNGSVVAAKGAPPVQGRTGAVQRAGRPNQKPAQKGPPLLLMIGGGMLAIVGIAAGVVMFGGNNSGPKPGEVVPGATRSSARATKTPPIFPGQLPGGILNPDSPIEKLPKEAKQWIDLGDSQRESNNLVQARRSFTNAKKIVPNCESCQVRIDAVDVQIEAAITSYEKSGTQAFEAGDFERAVQSWEIAISFIGDPKSPRAQQIKARIGDANKQIHPQPQE